MQVHTLTMKVSIRVLLVASVSLFAIAAQGQQLKPPSHVLRDWECRMGEPITQKLEVAWEGLLDYRASDFDQDGAVDLLFADARGIWICWGTGGGGIGPAESLFVPIEPIVQIAYSHVDDQHTYPQVLWVRTGEDHAPHSLKGWVFNGRKCMPFRELDLPATAIMRCVETGLLFGPSAHGELTLERQGVELHLAEWSDPIEDLDLVDVDGNGHADLVIFSENQIAIGFGAEEGFEEGFSSIQLKEPVTSWDVNADLSGQRGIVLKVENASNMQFWTHAQGEWTKADCDQPLRGKIINHHSDEFVGVVLNHYAVNQSLVAMPFQVDGRSFPVASLAEISSGQFIRIEDWNLDGLDDVVALDEVGRELIWIPNLGIPVAPSQAWSRTVLEVFSDSLPGTFELPYATGKPWRRGGSWTPGIREWMVAEGGAWGLGEEAFVRGFRESNQKEDPHDTLEDLIPFEPCVKVAYLDYVDEQQMACFGLDFNREWHRLTYSRDELGATTLVIDGQLKFDGFTTSRRFDHRWLQLGAGFGTKWGGFAEVDLDDVFIYKESWSVPEMLECHEMDTHPINAALKVQLDFDGENGREVLYAGETLNLEGGATLIPVGSGRALRFDGKSGKSHVFCDIPDEEIVVDYRFRLPEQPERFGIMVNLYGMFNLGFWLLNGKPFEGVATSPTQYMRENRLDEEGGYLFTWKGRVHRLLPAGVWQRFESGDWVSIGPSEAMHEPLTCTPWTQAQSAYAKIGFDGEIWSCESPDQPWTFFGKLKNELASFEHVSSNGKWTLIWDDSHEVFGWLETKSQLYYPQSKAVLPDEILAVRPAQGGVELLDASGNWWLIPVPGPGDRGVEAFDERGSNWGWFAVSAVLLAAVLSWRLRKKREAASDFEVPPLPVLQMLCQLKPLAGQVIDVNAFDRIVGLEDIETDETKRSRRSRAINELNNWSELQYGESWIRRKRDPSDRRRLLYSISENLGVSDWEAIADGADQF